MATCNGCGGIIGRDCFNPVECEQISHEMDIEAAINADRKRIEQAYYKQMEQEHNAHVEKYCNNYPGEWYQPLFDYMAKEHNVILLQSDMDAIISIVNTMQATPHHTKLKLNKMKREPGYYWVKFVRGWVIAFFEDDQWWMIGNSRETFEDNEFDYINETRLTSPAETGAQQ